MPRESHPFHIHTLDEVDIAQRIWGPAGVRAVLDIPEPAAHPSRADASLAPALPVVRARQPRAGFGWGWLRRSPRAAMR